MGKLTLRKITALTRSGEPGRYGDGQGLYLQIVGPSNVSWLFRYQRAGKERFMGLGPLRLIPLEEARQRAYAAARLVLDGKDPLAMRADERAAAALAAAHTVTFEQAAQMYHDHHSGKWRNPKHAEQFMSSLRMHIFPALGQLPVADIDTTVVLSALKDIWKKIPETASRLRGRIERVLAFATVRGYRQGENPARWRGHLSEMLSTAKVTKVAHHLALPFALTPEFMPQLAKVEGVPAKALEFLILTAARTGEVIGARWAEIDTKERTWTIPAERMKAGRRHRVPLSERAMALLEALPREEDNEFVFVGRKRGITIGDVALQRVLKFMGRTDFVPHGCRSTFRDWAAEKTTHAHHVVEAALAHAVGNQTERAYLRSNLMSQRANLMEMWAGFLYAPPAKGDVVPIRARV